MSESKPVLVMKGITKRFGDATVNDDINFDLYKGEVHTLMGENGAGKSTLVNIMCGIYQPTAGEICLKGERVVFSTPGVAVKKGIGVVHQHFKLVEVMTALENIILGTTFDKRILIHKKDITKHVMELSLRYGLEVDLNKRIDELSVGEQQRVEILKALYRGAEILILDEPTAVLTAEETQSLFQIIYALVSEGKSIVFISHKMREVMEISDRISVLRLGKHLGTFKKEETTADMLADLMVGYEVKTPVYQKVKKASDFVLEFNNVSYNKASKRGGLRNISLKVARGEIVGVAGVDGNGQTQLARMAAGMIQPEEGTVYLHGKRMLHSQPKSFIEEGVALIPEDRNKDGLVGDMNIADNLMLKKCDKKPYSRMKGWLMCYDAISLHAQQMCEKYDVRCASVNQSVRSLSGGNQQKVILARELEQNPKLIIATQPTRGLDIGATQYIHDAMIRSRDAGCGILFVSADLDEVCLMADRIVVMYEGAIIAEYSGSDLPVAEISQAMAGTVKAKTVG